MKKVVYLVSCLRNSGPTNQLYSIIYNLDRKKYIPYLLTLSPEIMNDSLIDSFRTLEIDFDSLNLSRVKGFIYARKELMSRLQRINPDIIHTQGIRADILSSKLSSVCPVLCTSRNYPYADYPAKFGKVRGLIMACQHISAMRRLNVVACSKAIQAQLGAHGIAATVVQNGVDCQKFQPVKNSVEKESLRQKLHIPNGATVFLSVGSLIPRKDMKTLVRAASRLDDSAGTRLVLLGDGPQMEMLQKMSEDLPVIFPGNVSNVADYLKAADVFVSASLAEGLPNSVLEAMACSLPCILSDIPSHRELFEGKSGLFFPCADVDVLVRQMLSLDAKKIAELGGCSRLIVEDRFSAQNMSQSYGAIYDEMMGGSYGK